MYIFLAALGLALLLDLVALACACRMLRNDMRRGKDCMDLSVPEAAANTRWAPYAAEVSESIKRLRALPWEEVRISAAEGFPLRARLLRGTSGDTAILVHGYRSCGELDFALTAEHYLELGFGLLMVDQRGHGGSGGKMVTMGLRESGDVRRWAEFAERELGGRIWLHGVSLGGASVLYAAGRGLPGSVRGIIADSSFCSPEEAIRWQLKKHSRGLRLLRCMIGAAGTLCMGRGFTKGGLERCVSRASQPMLFIMGGDDRSVPVDSGERLAAAAGQRGSLLVVPGAKHTTAWFRDYNACAAALDGFIERNK